MRPLLLIGTPAYGGWVTTSYTTAILELSHKIPIVLMTIDNESLVPRGRNKIFSFFVANKAFSHLLFWDADVWIHPDDVIKLLRRDKDIIGAAVRLKDLNRKVYNVGNILSDHEKELVKTDRLGTAIFMINRKAAEAVARHLEEKGEYWIDNGFYTLGHSNAVKGLKIYDAFKIGIFDGHYLSEDYYFCKLAMQLGFDIWVDQTIKTIHIGTIRLES